MRQFGHPGSASILRLGVSLHKLEDVAGGQGGLGFSV